MTFSRASLLATSAALAFAALARAQEVTPPSTPGDNTTTGPGAAGGAAPSLRGPIDTRTPSGGALPIRGSGGTNDTPLMPDQAPSLDKPENDTTPVPVAPEKTTKKTKTEAFEQSLKERIRFRQVETIALADRGVQTEWERSVAARTEAEKRAALQKYYKLLYARMTKLDASLKTLIDAQALLADHRLLQTRISPTHVTDEGERSTSARVFSD